MAIRTISATGGNWNSTATWEEGVVPVANDDVFGVTSSGNLTVNVQTALIKSLDLTYYTGTITSSGSGATTQAIFHTNRIQMASSGTNSSGVAWNVSPNLILGGTINATIGRDYAAGNCNTGIQMGPTFVTASTGLMMSFFNHSAGQVKFYSDLWCNSYYHANGSGAANTIDIGTFSINTSQFLVGGIIRTNSETAGFSTFKIVGDNVPFGKTFSACMIHTTNRYTTEFFNGTYSNAYRGLNLQYIWSNNSPQGLYIQAATGLTESNIIFRNGVKFIKTGAGVDDATNAMPEFTMTIQGISSANNWNIKILNESGFQIPRLRFYDSISNNNRIVTANTNQLNIDVIEHILDGNRVVQSTATQSNPTRWQGAGLSCSTYLTNGIYTSPGTNTSYYLTTPSPDGLGTAFNTMADFAIAPTLFFNSGVTHSIGRFLAINGDRKLTYRSATTTTPAYPRIASDDASKAKIQLGDGGLGFNYSIDNVDFLSKTFLSIGEGTITNSTGVTPGFPSGGVSAETSHTFVN